VPLQSLATTYYVSPSGNNTNGLSPNSAWNSITTVNNFNFAPGDSLLFEGNFTYTGNLEFDGMDANNSNNPFYIGSFGNGSATIQTLTAAKCGFKASNTQGIILENLLFQGPGVAIASNSDGVLFYTDLASGYLRNIQLKNIEVSGFGYCGIRFYSNWSAAVNAGFRNVKIDSCSVHDCRENGIVSIAYDTQNSSTYQHYGFQIKNTQVYDITGYSANSHKGSGIVLSQIDSALIERCVVHNTGSLNTACGGPGGIWVYAANQVIIQFNESHHNKAGSGNGCDGLGFDLDGGTTNSVLQFNYSHDNDGAGILLGNFPGARPWGNNIVRYNFSVNDARTNNSSVTLFTAPGTQWNGLRFHNNTIITSSSNSNAYPTFGAFQMTDYGSSMAGVECYNNQFITDGLPLINVPSTFMAENPKFINNLYWANGQLPEFFYGNTYNSLAAFRSAGLYCEKWNNVDYGMLLDPQLTNLWDAAPVLFPNPTESLMSFRLTSNSSAINNGLDLLPIFGFSNGFMDYFLHSLPLGLAHEIGAEEGVFSQVGLPNMEHSLTPLIYPNPLWSGEILNVTNDQNVRSIEVYDVQGRHHEFKETLVGKSVIFRLHPGNYLLKIETHTGEVNYVPLTVLN
jgi:hypothetical protein